MYAHIKELMPSHVAGAAMTGINFFTMIGAGVFIQGFGKLLESQVFAVFTPDTCYRIAFFVCFVGALIGVGLYAYTKDAIVQD
jgi:hypothetical protein